MIIDAHQHFWQLSRGDYDWLTPELAPLYANFLPGDLLPLLNNHGVDGTILVQAAPTLVETEYLLRLADETPFVLGVVGWVDFEAPTAVADIAGLAAHPKLVGLRPMMQDLPDDDWMLGDNLTPALHAMIAHDLTFDALVRPKHLPRLAKLLARHPTLRTVIDHGAKPDIAAGDIDTWATDIAKIADETGAYCKLSGLVTEAGDNWTKADITPYAQHLLASFGPQRLIWGSDWPVLNLASDYGTWYGLASSYLQDATDIKAIFGANAVDLYRLPKAAELTHKSPP